MQGHHYRPLPGSKPTPFPTRSPLQTAVGIVIGTALVGAGFVFAFAVSVVVLAIGSIGAAYLFWKTRAVRRELREQIEAAQRRAAPAEDGNVVEGEVIGEER